MHRATHIVQRFDRRITRALRALRHDGAHYFRLLNETFGTFPDRFKLKPIRERAEGFIEQPEVVRTIMAEGTERARDAAVETLDDVRSAMQLDYR